jgi:hypothetical protein
MLVTSVNGASLQPRQVFVYLILRATNRLALKMMHHPIPTFSNTPTLPPASHSAQP